MLRTVRRYLEQLVPPPGAPGDAPRPVAFAGKTQTKIVFHEAEPPPPPSRPLAEKPLDTRYGR